MSHGVHAVQHEAEHQIQHEQEHGHGGHAAPEKKDNNKKIALLISIMALFLAFSEMLGKGAQTEGIGYNIEAANLWNFFQAKTIRRTLVETAAQEMTVVQIGATSNDPLKAAMTKQILRPRRAAASSWLARRRPSTSATRRSPSTTTTRWHQRPCRSASCCARRQ
jgi:Domain of unknown function (DUF4337)